MRKLAEKNCLDEGERKDIYLDENSIFPQKSGFKKRAFK